MQLVGGGVFSMGTNRKRKYPQDGEGPERQVYVDDFLMDETTVTNEQFKEFVKVSTLICDAYWTLSTENQIPNRS